MHPQASENQLACQELFQALQACHANAWTKWTGGCNQIKLDLNRCLHSQSVARATKNREDAKVRSAKKEEAWRELHEDD